MPYEHLAEFLQELNDSGELVRVRAEVDPAFEITAIVDRLCRTAASAPAVFFERVKGSPYGCVAHLLGTTRRMCRVLGVSELDAAAEKVAGLCRVPVGGGLMEQLRHVPQFAQLGTLSPRLVRTAPCQQVVRLGKDVELGELPILTHWPGDAARLLTAGQFVTRFPETNERHVEQFPVAVRDGRRLAPLWGRSHAAAAAFERHRDRQTPLPVAIALGGDPVQGYVAAAPALPGVDAWLLAGVLRGQAIDVVKCRTNDLEVPAGAEFVVEGYIDPAEAWEPVGGVGRVTGFYSAPSAAPNLHVTAITHRSNPVYVAQIPAPPPHEEFCVRKTTERLYRPWVRGFVPELVDYNFPRSGGGRNLLYVSIRKSYPQQARKVLHALWGLDLTRSTKLIVVVDEQVDVQDEEQVWFYVGANVDPQRDVLTGEGPADELDHALRDPSLSRKLGLDATQKLPEEAGGRVWPAGAVSTPELDALVESRWAEYGLRR